MIPLFVPVSQIVMGPHGDGETDAGTDSCDGDAGGSLICYDKNTPTLVGIVSKGIGCGEAGKPGVYEDVYKYTNWINTIISRVFRFISVSEISIFHKSTDFEQNL